MSRNKFRPAFFKISFCLVCLIASAATVLSQDKPSPASDARKAFEKLKTLAGSWQGSVGGLSTRATIRVTSAGNAIIHDAYSTANTANNAITMIYLDGDRLLLTHYSDAGNRPMMVGKLLPNEKSVEFISLDVSGGKQRGFMKRIAFTVIDANRHGAEATYILPDGKPLEANGEFERINASLYSDNKRLYDGGAMLLLLSAQKMPEEYYGFKPIEAAPSFGQMLAVVANWQYENCSAVLGEKHSRPKIEAAKTSKADLIAALKNAFAYCGKAYDEITDASAAQPVMFSGPMGAVPTPKQQLLNNTGLNSLHYGNLMIYMSLKNIVPPSSDPEIRKQAEKLMKK